MDRPNIVLISIDTLRADHVSCYGYQRDTTPNLDRIAREGVLFRNAYAAAVWTQPAHASMFTGLYPSEHRTINFNKLDESIPTMAEILSANGYNTAGFVNNPMVGAMVGLERGYREFHEIWRGIPARNFVERAFGAIHRRIQGLLGTQDNGARKTNKLVKKWLRRTVSKEEPFFMFLHYIEPHNPLDAPHPYKNKFMVSDNSEPRDMSKIAAVAHNPLVCYTDNLALNKSENDYIISLYDGEIAYIDSMVDDVVTALEQLKALEDTVIIITADHGEHFGEHQHYSHVSSLYEPIVHVPLIIRYPKLYAAGQTFKPPVQHNDILPTILELASIQYALPEKSRAVSLAPENGKINVDESRSVFAEWEGKIPKFVRKRVQHNGNADKVGLFTKKLKMVKQENFKYIYAEDGQEELYDLREDPKELVNLAATKTDKCKALRESLNFLDADFSENERSEDDMDAAVKERLQGLGYL